MLCQISIEIRLEDSYLEVQEVSVEGKGTER